ncbi:MAG: hypothetical protein LBR88_10540 [Zoogloeaceae bacterium]|jgi:hypothetical protein|nr:hypothetical protein [Zoogloeaceae bacterium]
MSNDEDQDVLNKQGFLSAFQRFMNGGREQEGAQDGVQDAKMGNPKNMRGFLRPKGVLDAAIRFMRFDHSFPSYSKSYNNMYDQQMAKQHDIYTPNVYGRDGCNSAFLSTKGISVSENDYDEQLQALAAFEHSLEEFASILQSIPGEFTQHIQDARRLLMLEDYIQGFMERSRKAEERAEAVFDRLQGMRILIETRRAVIVRLQSTARQA